MISAIITAAGKNSRMQNDQIKRGIEPQNKLTLPFKNSNVINTTISNVISSNIDECIVVVGHYSTQIKEAISDNFKGSIKIIENNPVDVGLSVSLFNGLKNSKYEYALCVTADQPTVSTETFNNLIYQSINSQNPQKTISVLRRRKIGKLDTAEGLGMPFVAYRNNLLQYLENENDNLNPILRKIFDDGYDFYGIKEKNKEELFNINHYKDYQLLLNSF